jgi:hypothetical protein
VFTIVEDPIAAYAYSARHAQPDDLAALGERYGLDPDTAAQLLADAGTHPTTAIEALTIACNGDTATVDALAERHLNQPPTLLAPVIDLTTGAGLRAALPRPTATGIDDLATQLADLVVPSLDPPVLATHAQPEFRHESSARPRPPLVKPGMARRGIRRRLPLARPPPRPHRLRRTGGGAPMAQRLARRLP